MTAPCCALERSIARQPTSRVDRYIEERPGSETDLTLQVALAPIPTPTRPLAQSLSAAQRQAVVSLEVVALLAAARLEGLDQPTTPLPQLSAAIPQTLEAASSVRTRRLALALQRLEVVDYLGVAVLAADLAQPTPPLLRAASVPTLAALLAEAAILLRTTVPPTLLSNLSPKKMEPPATRNTRPSPFSSHTRTTPWKNCV